ncbi:MAG: 50S ribosomal protein L11 methyltransferase [Paludibacteraceae bacterium]|jgi:ribosomal protein L11 methyltransferase|nr:50S ribosomal protein L11 methyltransferase [Paludibacteraceae bacterium]
MQYSVVHLTYSFSETWQQDLFEQAMCDMGFEVFDGANAYIQTAILEGSQDMIQSLIANTEGVALVNIEQCEDINWNATWEAEHEIVELPLGVRITPHCAFGAGHHETTSMMIEALIEAQENGWFQQDRSILDMGCGTGVLGIMAKKCGATNVVAVDIDDKSVANSLENAAANGVEMDVRLGSTPPDGNYDLILANIHRNILIEQMPAYAQILTSNGEVWLSGFYAEDIPYISHIAESVGLHITETRNAKEWQWTRLKK